jgi:hypothetical protein
VKISDLISKLNKMPQDVEVFFDPEFENSDEVYSIDLVEPGEDGEAVYLLSEEEGEE